MELRREKQVNTARCMRCVATCRIRPRACLQVNYRDAQNPDDGESEPEYGAAATEEGETTDSELNAAFTDDEKENAPVRARSAPTPPHSRRVSSAALLSGDEGQAQGAARVEAQNR
jgi:hypothetical protein